jgi:hypothetical protein
MTDRDHHTEGWDCWCGPRVEQPCRHCQGEVWSASCVFCAGSGWEPAYDDETPAVVIHQRQEETLTPGQICYEGYIRAHFGTGHAVAWGYAMLDPHERDAWEAAAQAVLTMQEKEEDAP